MKKRRDDKKDELTLSLIYIINARCDQHHLLASLCHQAMLYIHDDAYASSTCTTSSWQLLADECIHKLMHQYLNSGTRT